MRYSIYMTYTTIAYDPLSLSTYPMITYMYTHPIAGNLPMKT